MVRTLVAKCEPRGSSLSSSSEAPRSQSSAMHAAAPRAAMQEQGGREVVACLESSVQQGTGQYLLQEKSRAQVLVLRELRAMPSHQSSRHVHPRDRYDSQAKEYARTTPEAGVGTPQRLLHLQHHRRAQAY
mmetsp:Transcript_11751/g.37566  ORF Transcript_11751/g.37566 Transcript_11751/m.37566 type:complete len:131 (-) Transcript_11751:668-1060(-)